MTRRHLLATPAASLAAQLAPARFSGITIMPEYVQNEGVEGALASLTGRARITALATSPYVMEPADGATGSREPPADADAGSVRLLDRPLWGKRELFVRTAPSFEPDRSLYRGLRYQPAEPTDLTRREGAKVAQFLAAARKAGVRTYLQVQAAIPPGYRVQFGGPLEEDRPRLPDGRLMTKRVANNGSLASPELIAYHSALLQDLAKAYPDVDGIRVDWPEYPPYFLDDAFLDFSGHAQTAAKRHGIDFERMRRDTLRLYQYLHGSLTNADLHLRGPYAALLLMSRYPGVADLLRLKALLMQEILAAFRKAIPARMELMPNAFPPPLTVLSGMDYALAAPLSSAISVKLYTMHWPMMLRFWGDQLKKANPGLDELLLVRALEDWLELRGEPGSRTLADTRYPEPEEVHPVSDAIMREKIVAAQRVAGTTPVIALAHGYGPLADFRRRMRVAYEAAGRRAWVNRYGYLSDAKLDAIGEICR
jgi:hypothetical protein